MPLTLRASTGATTSRPTLRGKALAARARCPHRVPLIPPPHQLTRPTPRGAAASPPARAPCHGNSPAPAPALRPRPRSTSPEPLSPIPAPGPGPDRHRDIELVTQVSLDRWPRFVQQALAWGGPVSVAVYLPCPPDHPLAVAYQDHLRGRVAALQEQVAAAAVAPPPRITVLEVHARRLAREGATVLPNVAAPQQPLLPLTPQPKEMRKDCGGDDNDEGVALCEQRQRQQQQQQQEGKVGDPPGDETQEEREEDPCLDLYPINALRNAALAAATCSHVWLVDGDFIPSRGLRESLLMPLQPEEADDGAFRGCSRTRNSSSTDCDTASSSSSGVSSDRGGGATAGGGDSRGAGSSSSLLELSDAHPRPVMWVVPAFELLGSSGSSSVLPGGGGDAPPLPTPAAGTHDVTAAGGTVAAAVTSSAAAVACEVPDSRIAEVPRTLDQLASCCCTALTRGDNSQGGSCSGGGGGATSALLLRPFHCGRYPQPINSIEYPRWWKAALGGASRFSAGSTGGRVASGGSDNGPAVEPAAAALIENPRWITVPYHEYFEPYGIVRRDQVPPYDERFRGYGLNKVQHAYHLAAAGFEFRVLTQHFCVTVPHARSVSYRAVFGTAADPQQRLRVEQLYDTFKQEMYNKYSYRYAAPWEELAPTHKPGGADAATGRGL